MENPPLQPVAGASQDDSRQMDAADGGALLRDEQHMTAQGTGLSRGASPRQPQRQVLDPLNLGILELVLYWCLWLLGSWAVTRWLAPTAVAGRLMVFAMLFGLLVLWPAYRLSQRGPHGQWASGAPGPPGSSGSGGSAGGGASGGGGECVDEAGNLPESGTLRGSWCFLLDWLVLMIVMQAVIWPLGIVCTWSLGQLLAVNLTLACWSLIVGQFIAWGSISPHAGPRNLAMALCLVVVLAQPVAAWVLGHWGVHWPWLENLGPLAQIAELTRRQPDALRLDLLHGVWPVAAAGVLGWVVLLGWRAALWFQRHAQQRHADQGDG